MNHYSSQHFHSNDDSLFDFQQENEEKPPFPPERHHQDPSQPDTTIDPREHFLNQNIYPSLGPAPSANPRMLSPFKPTTCFDWNSTMLNCNDRMTRERARLVEHGPSMASLPASRPQAPTGAAYASLAQNVSPTCYSQFSLENLPAAPCSFPLTSQAPTIKRNVRESFRLETLHQPDHQESRPFRHTPPEAGGPNRSSGSSTKQPRPRALAKAGSKSPVHLATNTSPRSSSSSLRSFNAQEETADIQPSSKSKFEDICLSGKKCGKTMPPISSEKWEITLRYSHAEGRRLLSNSDSEKTQVAGRESRKKPKGKSGSRRPAESAHSEIDKIPGWGWRTREVNDAWPAFGGTKETRPLFDAQGQHVGTSLHGTFHFSRGQKGEVSNDGGEIVHELQKRNIFHIKDMHYILAPPHGASTYLTVEHGDFLKRIHRMSIRLIGRDFDGDFKHSRETPLETRGKARGFTSAREWNETIPMRPRGSDETSRYPELTSDIDRKTLPDVFSAMHLEFRRATPGNKTTGVWRLPTQHYYRLVIQLCAALGGTDGLVVVAERSTELLLVRGRPPGGREKAKRNTSQTCIKNATKSSKDSTRQVSSKKQRRTRQVKLEDEEEDWADDLTQEHLTESSPVQANRERASQDGRGDSEPKPTSRHYNTRNAYKRTYKESNLDTDHSGNEDGEYEIDDGSEDYSEEEAEENPMEELEDSPRHRSNNYSSREDMNNTQDEVNDKARHQSEGTDWCTSDDEYGNEFDDTLAPQALQTASQEFENDSDDNDSVMNDVLGVEGVIDSFVERNSFSQPTEEHWSLPSIDLEPNGVRHQSTNSMCAQQHINSYHTRATHESPQMLSDRTQQQSRSRIPRPEITLDTTAPSNSNSESPSYTPSSTEGQHQNRSNTPMAADFLTEMGSYLDPVLSETFESPPSFQDWLTGSD